MHGGRHQTAPVSPITVVIPTRDEALHIGRCIRTAGPLGPVVVIDSGSTDGTQRLAQECGARVIHHDWQGYAAQKNWALGNLPSSAEWVLFLDADEFLTDAGRAEIEAAILRAPFAGFYLPRLFIFLGRPLRHAWWYPDHQLRLFRLGRGRFEDRTVHEHVILDGAAGTLRAPIMHENLKGLSAFIERHNRYSDLEAEQLCRPSGPTKPGAFTGSWAERRRALKERVWFRLPMRPAIRFLWLFFIKRGFLDGRRGFVFCGLIAIYDFFIDVKVWERRLRAPYPRTSRAPADEEPPLKPGPDGD